MGRAGYDEEVLREALDPLLDTPLDSIAEGLGRLYEARPEAIVVHDPAGLLSYSNLAFDDLVGYDIARFRGQPPPYPYWRDDTTRLSEALAGVLSGRLEAEGVRAIAACLTHESGLRIPVVVTGRIVESPRGTIASYLFTVSPSARPARLPPHPVEPTRVLLEDLERELVSGELPNSNLPLLSRREREVADLLLRAVAVPEIGRMLLISEHTVRNHKKSIYKKLGAHSVIELVHKLRPTYG